MNRRLGPIRQPRSREGLTRSQAERALRRRTEREQVIATITARLTVEEAGERLPARPPRGPGPQADHTPHLPLDLADAPSGGMSDKTLKRITAEDVERMIASMWRDGAGAKTINNALTLLGHVFDHGARRGWCVSNPARVVDRPRVEQSEEIRFLDQAELEALLRAIPDPTDRTSFLVAAETGLRQDELFGLRWIDSDWTPGRSGSPQLRPRPLDHPEVAAVEPGGADGRPRGERARAPLPALALPGRRRLRVLLPREGHRARPLKLGRRFHGTLDAAGVRRIRFHDGRHTFGTRMAAARVRMRTLQEWLGHRAFEATSDMRTTPHPPGRRSLWLAPSQRQGQFRGEN
jgi:integrase